MKKVLVLGGGMVGSAIAIDLASDYEVTVLDHDEERLEFLKAHHPLGTVVGDVTRVENLRKATKGCDLVIEAVPGHLGFAALKTIIALGKDVVDISFFDEDPFTLHVMALEKDVTAVVDCGIAPGLSNAILGYHARRMEVDSYECLVGGLPCKRTWPYQYKAPFSPIDVIEEYTRPARLVEDGVLVTKPALSDASLVEIDPIGTLEAFNTDGLRTLLKTMKIRTMREQTLRYPGHIDYIRVLRKSGLFGKEPVSVGDGWVRPIDLTTKLLFPLWRLDENEAEFTVMQIRIRGKEEEKWKEYVYRLFDRFDQSTKVSSMARTTGYTCTAVARLLLEGLFTQKGICPPEDVGANEECFHRILKELKDHNVHCTSEERPIKKT